MAMQRDAEDRIESFWGLPPAGARALLLESLAKADRSGRDGNREYVRVDSFGVQSQMADGQKHCSVRGGAILAGSQGWYTRVCSVRHQKGFVKCAKLVTHWCDPGQHQLFEVKTVRG